MATQVDGRFGSIRSYWSRIRSMLASARTHETVSSQKRTTTEIRVAHLGLLQQVALTLFDRYNMPAWSIDGQGDYLAPLNVTARRMTTRFAETMGTERPPEFTDQEREDLVSKAMAMLTVVESHPTIFMTEKANWLVFSVDDPHASCAIVLVR